MVNGYRREANSTTCEVLIMKKSRPKSRGKRTIFLSDIPPRSVVEITKFGIGLVRYMTYGFMSLHFSKALSVLGVTLIQDYM